MATTKRAPARRQTTFMPVLWFSAMALLTIGGALALQLRAGHDPAFAKSGASAAVPRRPLIIRRVIHTRVVVVDAAADPVQRRGSADGQGGKAMTSAPGGTKQVVPSPARAAPAPVSPAAPATAPVTRSS